MNDRYKAALPAGELVSFPITPLDTAGVPVWTALFFAAGATRWSSAVPNAQGYGATDEDAERGALGELHEFVSADATLTSVPRRRSSYAALARAYGAHGAVHPFAFNLPAGSDVDDNTPLDWIRATRFATAETVWVPIDIVAVVDTDLPDGYRPFTTPITNGLGAGPSLPFALAHGLQELLQRDGNGVRFRALDSGTVLDVATVRDRVARDLMAHYASLGIGVLAKFASDEFGIANVYVVGYDDAAAGSQPLAVTACGEAASPDRDVALRKALLEYGAARARKAFSHGPLDAVATVAPPGYVERARARFDPAAQESRALTAMLAWLDCDRPHLRALLSNTVFARRTTKAFADLPQWQTPENEPEPGGALCATLTQRLLTAGLDVLYVDLSTATGRQHGVAAVKAIVPGLEVETMSYHRIGERNVRKLLASQSELVVINDTAPSAHHAPVRLLPDARERLGGSAWFDRAAADRIVGRLYPLYREPEIHTAALAREALVG